jgi:hypothetical protein
MMAHYGNPNVQIELLDQGMIAHYSVPVKQMKHVRRSTEPLSVILEAMLPKILEQLSGTEDGEDWSEEKRAKKEMMQTAMDKAQELINPKPKEAWVWSSVRVVVADAKDLPNVIEMARKGLDLAKQLQEKGEYIGQSHAQLVAPFGDYIGGSAFSALAPGAPPPTPMSPSDLI